GVVLEEPFELQVLGVAVGPQALVALGAVLGLQRLLIDLGPDGSIVGQRHRGPSQVALFGRTPTFVGPVWQPSRSSRLKAPRSDCASRQTARRRSGARCGWRRCACAS